MKCQQIGFHPFKNKLCVIPVVDCIRRQLEEMVGSAFKVCLLEDVSSLDLKKGDEV
ncbi:MULTISPECIES: hypothetical protein [Terrabacteria group]|uniref:hypothetical protein n=1 Tax=Bacillati TaxID=1783272 RepID=UPI001939C253|nr:MULTISPECIES: hypothetical protein [Terrabacteria group]MBW9213009.1 hypothetical protein [Trueperella sp. zg.1013]QRG87051.1 hypothetical protein JOS54_01720 [Bulleidia sp. zg-1006]